MIERARNGLGVVVALWALSATVGAQAQMSPAEVEAVKKDVVAHLDKYYRAFTELRPDVLAGEVFNIPWVVIGANGPQADMTREEAHARFQASMTQLTESGWARSVFTTESVCVLNGTAAIASGYNTRYKKDGSVMSVGGVTYVLGKSKDGWRIVSYSGHPKGKGVRCE
ncbi:MAG: hypothetical protein U0Q12_26590 [Vicinamibacterales bacterium]